MTAAAGHEQRMLVDGELVESDTRKTFDNVDPATEEVLGQVADGSSADMLRAIDGARRAFDESDWSTDRALRTHCLSQLQDALEKEREELREELILEVGCPRMTTHANQLDIPLDGALRYPVKLIDEFPWRTDLSEIVDRRGTANTRQIWKEPIGVVGAIVPWNFPLEVTLNKLGQALATGNTVILKPAPDTPWNATRLGRLIAEETDFPSGVLNVVTSSDHLVGEELTLSPKVDLISFTGSTAVGKRIMEKGGATLKRTFLELGGKSATIILDDAPDFAASVMRSMVCFHAGQGCAIHTRMLLPRSRYEEAITALQKGYAGYAAKWGDFNDPSQVMGPVISKRQLDRVMGYIELGQKEGARLLAGGHVRTDKGGGFFVEPTCFVDVTNDMRIAREEIFGPVLAGIPYENDEDAIRIANDSEYGLCGMVISADKERAMRVARRIRAGSVSINGGMCIAPDLPFGGYKSSGIGREWGLEGIEEYLETKAIGVAA